MIFHRFVKVLLSIIFALLANFGLLSAQLLEEQNFTKYTSLQGLSNNYISGIIQDTSGYIWIATHKGLNSFNGKSFESVFKGSAASPLPDNLLYSLHHLPTNEILGTTLAGAFTFFPCNGTYKKFIVPGDSAILFWMNQAQDIEKDNAGNYIVSTKTGMYVFDKNGRIIRRYDHYKSSDAGRIELMFGGWVARLWNGNVFQQNALSGSVYDPSVNRIDTSYFAHRKDLVQWARGEKNYNAAIRGDERHLMILNNDINTIEWADLEDGIHTASHMPFDINKELGSNSRLTDIGDNQFIITCRNSGLYTLKYDRMSRQFSCDGKKYFRGKLCTTVLKDREGRLWIGTSDGLYKQNLQQSFFELTDLSLQSPFLRDGAVRCIYADKSFLYVGLMDENGLLVLDKKTRRITKHFRFSPGTKYSNTISAIFPFDRDTLWISTDKGILWWNKKNHQYGEVQVPPSLSATMRNRSRCFFEDSKKNIWMSFSEVNSLVRYNRSERTFTNISAGNQLLKITFVFSMAEDLQGNIWLAGDGLCRWNIQKKRVDTLIPYPSVSKMLLKYMLILDRDSNNNLWLSSFENEIIQYNCTTNEMTLRQQEDNFVDGNTVTSSPIIDNNIWMGTDNGISAFDIKYYTVRQFTYADGLPSVAISSYRKGSFYDTTLNRFYIGAGHQLYSFIPDNTLLHKTAPLLWIEKVNVGDTVILPANNELHLQHKQNNITIYFNAINFTDPEENRFAWRPAGYHGNWNSLNDQTSITLTNLAGGWHTIQIILYSANNHWRSQVRTFRVYIKPPFWEEPWFIAFVLMVLIGSVMLIYNNRVSTVKKKALEKAQVQELITEEYRNRLELEQISNFFSYRIADKKTSDEVLWDVTKNLIGQMNYEDCIIYMWNKDKTKMVQKAAFGPKGTPKAIKLHEFDVVPGQGIVGQVMISREPLLVSDTRKDPRYRVDDMNRLSELCVPIVHDNEMIGIIDSEHSEANHFKERDIKILTTIAALVGNKLRQIESQQLLEVKQKEIVSINQQLAEAQLSALQTQMNPHFIFNSLNSIKGMILANEQQKASRYLSKFANMIRTTLDQSKSTFTTLYENIEHLESYLLMEKLRFGDSFTYRIEVDEKIDKEETLVPTLMLQPLAENAIWHGLMLCDGAKNLTISFNRRGNAVKCCIEDNGIGIEQSQLLKNIHRPTHESVGLNNLRNRIKILNEKYDTHCSLEIKDLKKNGNGRTGTQAILRFNILMNKSLI